MGLYIYEHDEHQCKQSFVSIFSKFKIPPNPSYNFEVDKWYRVPFDFSLDHIHYSENLSDVSVFHYSGKMIKPWDFVVESRYKKKMQEDRETKTRYEGARYGDSSSKDGNTKDGSSSKDYNKTINVDNKNISDAESKQNTPTRSLSQEKSESPEGGQGNVDSYNYSENYNSGSPGWTWVKEGNKDIMVGYGGYTGSWRKEGDTWRWSDNNTGKRGGQEENITTWKSDNNITWKSGNNVQSNVVKDDVMKDIDFENTDLLQNRPEKEVIMERVQSYFDEDLAMHGETK